MTVKENQDKQSPDSEEIENLDHVMIARREKLNKILESGINPFPYRFDRTHSVESALKDFESLSESETEITLSGRLVSIRLMGKASFANIQDEAARIQIYFKKNIIGDAAWELFRLLDIGDIIGIRGSLFITRTGERTLKVNGFELLSKNLRPLPAVKEKDGETWFSWDDKEERYRNRTIDLILNSDSRNILVYRSRIVREIRRFMEDNDFLEVETPILQPLYGGAAARPFLTRYNALDHDFFLRIADELYLKRLVAGGLPRVFEIAKDFRNEGIDRLHSPEFTMMEFYAAWEDYHFCADLMEKMLVRLSENVLERKVITFTDNEIDLTPPYRKVTMAELVREACGIEIVARDRDELAADAKNLGIVPDKSWGAGKIIDEIFSEKVEPDLIQPTFVMDHPIELSPLAKKHRTDQGVVERFELYIGGLEIANSFSELNDPLDQRRRFEEQVRLIEDGDDEAHPIDENFLQSLEIGMPPTAGLGTGIDRLVMVLTGASSLRDVILFPTLRPRD